MQKWMEQFNAAQVAVYFASADKLTQLVGFGCTDELVGWPNDQVLNQWLARQTGTVFGGLPFDDQIQASTLMNGYFFVPERVIDLTDEQSVWFEPVIEAEPALTNQISIEQSEDDWVARMTPTLQALREDQTKQKIVLGMQCHLKLTHPLNVAHLLNDLRQQQPNAYHFVLKKDDELFVSATPERLVRLTQGGFETAAVAGSTKRGSDAVMDTQLADELWQDSKNRAEHAVVVDCIVERLQDIANMAYATEPTLLKTPQIQHLYTPITGELLQDTNLIALLRRLHPTPALGGMPTDWAKKTIQEVELTPRGLFAAPIGYVKPDGTGEFVVGIRSMLEQAQQVHLFAGAGILADSNLTQEAAEIELKMTPMKELIEAQL